MLNMKGKAKRKVVTSGRLTGAVKANEANAAAGAEPAYSLYSTDSEDQVTTLHKGLDRCAALLNGILHAEKAASPSIPRTVKGVGAKSRLSASLGKKTIKKPSTKTAPATRTPPAHMGVKLHPPHRPRVPAPPKGPTPSLSRTPPPPQTSVLLSVHQSSSLPDLGQSQRKSDRDAEEPVPVRNVAHPEPEEVREEESRNKTVQHLLSELRTLITGQGSVAEKLLSHLEQTVSSPQTNIQSTPELSSLQSQNAQLRRRVKILNQQLKEREKVERRQNLDTLGTSDAVSLQEELLTAQSRLQELQDDLAGLRKSLQDTQSKLRDREVENALLKTDLEATRSTLIRSEREKSELALLAQERLEEIGHLSRLLQTSCPTAADATQDSPALPADRVTQYLLSLGQPVQVERVAAEKDENAPSQPEEAVNATMSQFDIESVCSDWSMRSGSSFNTRDEAAFRDGLAALDASIASLQKTMQLELKR